MAPAAPDSRSIGAETSPVNAPSASQCTFWAKTRIPLSASAETAAGRETWGGATTISTPSGTSPSRSCAQKASVSPGPLNIFQLPAISTCGGS